MALRGSAWVAASEILPSAPCTGSRARARLWSAPVTGERSRCCQHGFTCRLCENSMSSKCWELWGVRLSRSVVWRRWPWSCLPREVTGPGTGGVWLMAGSGLWRPAGPVRRESSLMRPGSRVRPRFTC